MPTENRTTLTPDTPVRYLKGVGPKTAERFEKLGIVTLADLLCHYPRRYIDFSKPYSIAEAPADTECVVKAEVFAKPGGRILPGGRRMERITAGDDVASLEITWFNNPYATQKLQLGQEYYFQGIVTGGMLRRQMVNPQVRTAEQIQAAPFEAVYPQTEGLSSSAISRCIRQLLPHAELLPDPLPPEMLQKYRLLPKAEAVRAIHCPATEEQAAAARRRLIYEELLVLQLGIGRMRSRGAAVTGAPMRRADPSPFWQSLPFAPTGAQRRAVEEILNDMACDTAMNRLLQGDVGSGKTLVAAAAIWACIRAGYQAALLAPTEILAAQHAEGLNRLLAPFGMRVALLTGGMKLAARRRALALAASGDPGIIVAPHAAFSKTFQAPNLALVVIDEQHRFGVEQRESLRTKNDVVPHLLVMTATPIPRTAAMTWFGDLDISWLTELPGGRKPIRTFIVPEDDGRMMGSMFAHIRGRIDAGERAYVVCPRIDADDESDGDDDTSGASQIGVYDDSDAYRRESATAAANTSASAPSQEDGDGAPSRPPLHSVAEIERRLSSLPQFRGIRFATLTGRDDDATKQQVMADFADGATPVLVATTVIEVGVDVPQASCIVIFDADRYGLSQLHQLRGRVGRGGTDSWAFLISRAEDGGPAQQRLQVIQGTLDGAQIAQADLEFRGAGDVLGDAQSGGKSGLKLLRVVKDADMIADARTRAGQLLAADPELAGEVQLAGAVLDFTRGNETFLTSS